MTLCLEALTAWDGDCLLLHHGSLREPRLILIDGGRSRTVATTLMPRLLELRRAWAHQSGDDELPINLAVLSHIDADHVEGLLDLTADMVTRQEAGERARWWIGELWMNSFDDRLDNEETRRLFAPTAPVPAGLAASLPQAQALRANLQRLEVAINQSTGGELIGRPDDRALPLPWGELTLTVLAPTQTELRALEQEWDRELRALRAGKRTSDGEVINAASIVLLVAHGAHQLLLTGDAYSAQILDGLTAAGRLRADGPPCQVDLLKLPHHGAEGNCLPALFERVHARHYVLSARYDTRNRNPDARTLERLWDARGADAATWTLHVTFRRGEIHHFDAWRDQHPSLQVRYRDEHEPGVRIALE